MGMNFKTAKALAAVAMVGSITAAVLPAVSSASATVSDSTFNTSFSTMKNLKSILDLG